MTETFQCVYCGERIQEVALDPCELTLVVSGPQESPERQQTFWCHAACFRRCAFKNVPLYVLALSSDSGPIYGLSAGDT
jgi:hypothetical protein